MAQQANNLRSVMLEVGSREGRLAADWIFGGPDPSTQGHSQPTPQANAQRVQHKLGLMSAALSEIQVYACNFQCLSSHILGSYAECSDYMNWPWDIFGL